MLVTAKKPRTLQPRVPRTSPAAVPGKPSPKRKRKLLTNSAGYGDTSMSKIKRSKSETNVESDNAIEDVFMLSRSVSGLDRNQAAVAELRRQNEQATEEIYGCSRRRSQGLDLLALATQSSRLKAGMPVYTPESSPPAETHLRQKPSSVHGDVDPETPQVTPVPSADNVCPELNDIAISPTDTMQPSHASTEGLTQTPNVDIERTQNTGHASITPPMALPGVPRAISPMTTPLASCLPEAMQHIPTPLCLLGDKCQEGGTTTLASPFSLRHHANGSMPTTPLNTPIGLESNAQSVTLGPKVEKAALAVAEKAQAAAVSSALQWLDMLWLDVKGRLAAAKRSQRRVQRSHQDWQECVNSNQRESTSAAPDNADIAAANTLLQGLDMALEGEAVKIQHTLQQVEEIRAMCGAATAPKRPLCGRHANREKGRDFDVGTSATHREDYCNETKSSSYQMHAGENKEQGLWAAAAAVMCTSSASASKKPNMPLAPVSLATTGSVPPGIGRVVVSPVMQTLEPVKIENIIRDM